MKQQGLRDQLKTMCTRVDSYLAAVEQSYGGVYWLTLLTSLAASVYALVFVGLVWFAGVVTALGLCGIGFFFWRRHGWLVEATAPAVVVLAIGGILLFATGQGRDLGMAIVDADLVQVLFFGTALVYWASAVWHNSRVRVDVAFANREKVARSATPHRDWARQAGGTAEPASEQPWRKWTPRLLGALVFLMALIQLVLVGWPFTSERPLPWLAFAAIGGGLAVYLAGVVCRRDWLVPWLRSLIRRFPGQLEARAVAAARLRPRAAALRRRAGAGDREMVAPASSIVTSLVFLVIGLVIALLAWAAPVALGWFAGSMTLGFFAFGVYLVLLTLIWIWSNRWGFSQWRVLVPVLALAIAGNLTRPYHEVRLVDYGSDRTTVLDKQLGLDDAIAAWHAAPGKVHGDAAVPMIVVATAGGGLRAAYWTAAVLADLELRIAEQTGDPAAFRRHLFAISGVSGGSVGASFFAQHTSADPLPPLDESPVLAALEHDFLAPTLAALAFVDLPSLILPSFGQAGRGVVLERAFEEGFLASTGQRLDIPFLDARQGPGWRPLLLLNGTHQKSGRRLIASHVSLARETFLDSFDMHHLLGADVALSTAAHNSARFTYVSPAGALRDRDGVPLGHVIDGGYFENFGAMTALQLTRAAVDRSVPHARVVRPIIIQISSDPKLGARDRAALEDVTSCAVRSEALPFDDSDHSRFWANSQLLAPLRGILATRQAQGILASQELAQLACRLGEEASRAEPVFVHFALCDKVNPPLGWVMSDASRKAIRGLVQEDHCANATAVAKVLKAFPESATASAQPQIPMPDPDARS